MRAYIVRTPDGYLYPFDGDVSLTDDRMQAGHFLSISEAEMAFETNGYRADTCRVLPVEVDNDKLIRS